MKEFLFLVTDYLKGNPSYPVIRRGLNFMLNVSISAFLFEKFIGPYKWIDLIDYKSLLDFFVRGHFILPLSFYVLTYFIIFSVAFLIFDFRLDFKKHKSIANIKDKEFGKEDLETLQLGLSKINTFLKFDLFTKDEVFTFYKSNFAHIPQHDLVAIKQLLHNQKTNLSRQFYLAFRFLVAIVLYNSNLPLGLFWILVLSILVVVFLITKAFRLLNVIPTIHEVINKNFFN